MQFRCRSPASPVHLRILTHNFTLRWALHTVLQFCPISTIPPLPTVLQFCPVSNIPPLPTVLQFFPVSTIPPLPTLIQFSPVSTIPPLPTVLQLCPVSTIPPLHHSHPHRHSSITRRANGRSSPSKRHDLSQIVGKVQNQKSGHDNVIICAKERMKCC